MIILPDLAPTKMQMTIFFKMTYFEIAVDRQGATPTLSGAWKNYQFCSTYKPIPKQNDQK